MGAGALLDWRQLAADLQGCGRKEFAYIGAALNGEEGGFRQTRGSEITQWMCSFTLAAPLKWGAEITQWMCNFLPVPTPDGAQKLNSGCAIFSLWGPLKWGGEITQWMCNFAPAAILKWGAEIEQWMFNFSPVAGLEWRQNSQRNVIILLKGRRSD